MIRYKESVMLSTFGFILSQEERVLLVFGMWDHVLSFESSGSNFGIRNLLFSLSQFWNFEADLVGDLTYTNNDSVCPQLVAEFLSIVNVEMCGSVSSWGITGRLCKLEVCLCEEERGGVRPWSCSLLRVLSGAGCWLQNNGAGAAEGCRWMLWVNQ